MKLHTKEHNITRGGVTVEAEFKIKQTAKSFEILSGGLYSDAILAVVRELSCNAWDSHVEAGKGTVPFKIHLPNQLEPFLSIRDFGLGLCEDDVLNLYTTYFESTKTNSNDYIGALGLGSKSPFAYADNFEVISIFNGTQTLYSVFLNESGIPTIAKMGDHPTDESNGLEVKLTVKDTDFHTFADRASEVLKFFEPKPEVVGYSNFAFKSLPENNIQGDGWFVAPREWSNQRFTAVQGNVPYRVDIDQIKDSLTDEEQRFFYEAQIVAFFEIGDLEVAASREEIKYTGPTKEALVKMARQIRVDMVKVIEEDMTDLSMDNLWDAYITLDEYSETTFNNSSSLRKFIDGENVTNKILLEYVASRGTIEVDIKMEDMKHWTWVGYSRPKHSITTMPRLKSNFPQAISPRNGISFVINDVKKGGIKRTANWTRGEEVKTIYMLKPVDFDNTSKAKSNELKTILAAFGNPASIKSSDMENPTTTRTGPIKRLLSFFQYDRAGYKYRKQYTVWNTIDSDDADAPKEGLYFFLSRGKTMHMGNDTNSDKALDEGGYGNYQPREYLTQMQGLLTLINEVKGTSYTKADIYGVPVKTLKMIKDDSNWNNIFDLAHECLSHFTDGVAYLNNFRKTPDELGFKTLMEEDLFRSDVRSLDANSVFRQVLEPVFDAEEFHTEEFLRFSKLAQHHDAVLHRDVVFNKTSEEFFQKGVFDSYPMLTLVDDLQYSSPKQRTVLFDYITLIDRG